jgi:alkanesulfonate monooxygenase SsuD/methylene tetrahydromethanopterin reductase-like flavin-dependent oxidoreductase (luciferase family)
MMRFALFQEADFAPGRERERYKEMLVEACFAEEMGFDVYGVSEQHFNETVATVSAPDAIFGYLCGKTERIRFRFASAVMLAFNHPLRIAERVATIDVLSDGRVELGTARSNNPYTLEAFQVDPSTTRAQWAESLKIVIEALSNDPFEFDGEIWKIPPRTLTPKVVQKPHPPIYVAATSIETHGIAGRMGLGVMCGNSLPGGFDYVAACVDAYEKGFESLEAVGGRVTHELGCFVATAHVAETGEQAKSEAAEGAFRFVDLMIDWYGNLAQTSPDYAYLSRISEVIEHRRDLDHLIERSPYISIGDVDFWIARLKLLEEMGVTEMLLRIDGLTHEHHMKAIELFGTRVFPAVRGS